MGGTSGGRPRYRTRLAQRDDDATLRSPGSRTRTVARDHFTTRQRHPWRSRARPLPEPGDIKGTALLVWEHLTTEDERFLFLPALGRVRRIAGSEKQESFVGSDLTYEDFGGREIDSYTYAFAPGSPTWTDPAGAIHAVWHLESKAKDASVPYPRAISIIRRDNFVAVGADIFNRRNEPEKRYEVKRLQQVDGIWTAMELVMSNTAEKTRTELVVSSANYNVGLAESDFTRRVLEQGKR